ncbi:MAG: hypothetical protein AAF517_22230 [Planctomycetota bacterium]
MRWAVLVTWVLVGCEATGSKAPEAPIPASAETPISDPPEIPESASLTWSVEIADRYHSEEDQADFTSHLEAARGYVEEHTGIAFTSLPKVDVLEDGAWTELVRSEIPNARDPGLAVALTIALYQPEKKTLSFSPFFFHQFRSATDELKLLGRATLAHELTHHLDEEKFRLPSRLRETKLVQEKFVLRGLAEGHAVLVEEWVSEEKAGVENFMEHNAKRLSRDPSYVLGRNYFKSVESTETKIDLRRHLLDDVPTYTEFMKGAMQPGGVR